MKLTIPERICIQDYIPSKGLYANMAEVRQVMDGIAFNPEELETYKIVGLPNGRVQYDEQASLGYVVDVPMTEWVTHEVEAALIERERKSELPLSHITLYEKFVIDRSN